MLSNSLPPSDGHPPCTGLSCAVADSSFAYSHRSKGAGTPFTSTRAFFGQIVARDKRLASAMEAVLVNAGATSSPLHTMSPAQLDAHGIRLSTVGWDVEARHLKLYIAFVDAARLPAPLLAPLHRYAAREDVRNATADLTNYHHGGLVGYIYGPPDARGHAELLETKLYMYPRDPAAYVRAHSPMSVPPFTSAAAVFSDRRGFFLQYDLENDGARAPTVAAR